MPVQPAQPALAPSPTRVPPPPTPVPPAPTRVAAIPTVRSGPTGTTIPNGTWLVPADVAPGTYRTRTASSGCYWARLSGFGGSDILANDNAYGPAIVTIGAGDQGFQSSRCSTWTKDLSPITPSQTSPFRDGTYIVGVDIAPGTWRADASSTCYWERLRGFSGGLGEIIDNDNSVGIVTIAASDRGFSSSRCGQWTKVR